MNRFLGAVLLVAALLLSQLDLSRARGACDLDSAFQGSWYLPATGSKFLDDYGFGIGALSGLIRDASFDCRSELNTPDTALHESSQYMWAPKACSLRYAYPSKEFILWVLKRYSGHDILFLGDSKIRQVATALMRQMYRGNQKSEVQWKASKDSLSVKTESTKVSFVRSNFLAPAYFSKNPITVTVGQLDTTIKGKLRTRCPSIIVAGTGAWWTNHGKLYQFSNGTEVDDLTGFTETAKVAFPEMAGLCPSSKLIVLDAHFPHWMVPAGSIADEDGYSRGSFCNATAPLSYDRPDDVKTMKDDLKRHERLNLSWLLDHNAIPNAHYVSMVNLLLQRIDMHPGHLNKKHDDCSHYCEPGPVDYAAVMLMQAMDTQFGSSL